MCVYILNCFTPPIVNSVLLQWMPLSVLKYRDKYQEEYRRNCPDISAPTLPTPEDQLGAEMDSIKGWPGWGYHFIDTGHTPCWWCTYLCHPRCGSWIVAKTKRHRLSLAAIDDVQIVGTISEHMVIESLTAVRQSCVAHGMDMSSPFFQDLPGILENVSNPLATLGTAYRQQSYVKLPLRGQYKTEVYKLIYTFAPNCRNLFGMRLRHT